MKIGSRAKSRPINLAVSECIVIFKCPFNRRPFFRQGTPLRVSFVLIECSPSFGHILLHKSSKVFF